MNNFQEFSIVQAPKKEDLWKSLSSGELNKRVKVHFTVKTRRGSKAKLFIQINSLTRNNGPSTYNFKGRGRIDNEGSTVQMNGRCSLTPNANREFGFVKANTNKRKKKNRNKKKLY